MEAGLRVLLLAPLLAAFTAIAPAAAATPPAPEIERPDRPVFQPEVERRTIDLATIDSHDIEIGPYIGLLSVEDFGVNPVLGVRAAYHVTEDLFVEAATGSADTQRTSYERLSGAAQLLTDAQRRFSYYNMSVGYNILPGESFAGSGLAFNSALYLIGGIGVTTFAGSDRHTVNFGFGYRLVATDWLAIHIGVRDYVFSHDLFGADKTTNNLELQAAATWFF